MPLPANLPQNPTTTDTITFSAIGTYPTGIQKLLMYAADVDLNPLKTCTSTSTTMICTATHKFTTTYDHLAWGVDMYDGSGAFLSQFSQSEIFPITVGSTVTPTPSPTPLPTSSPTPAPKTLVCGGYGDVDLDGNISQNDINWISDQIAGRRSFTDEQKRKADVNGDNNITNDDILKIQGYLGGNLVNFPICQPIIISNVTAVNVTTNQATISWTASNPGTSKVVYGTSRSNLNQSAQDLTYKLNPSITLTNLLPNKLYFYKVQSQNGAGLVESSIGVLRTKSQ